MQVELPIHENLCMVLIPLCKDNLNLPMFVFFFCPVLGYVLIGLRPGGWKLVQSRQKPLSRFLSTRIDKESRIFDVFFCYNRWYPAGKSNSAKANHVNLTIFGWLLNKFFLDGYAFNSQTNESFSLNNICYMLHAANFPWHGKMLKCSTQSKADKLSHQIKTFLKSTK